MLSVLFAASMIVMLPFQNPVVFAPIEGEIERHRCDPRPCLLPQPQPAHLQAGRFSAYFQQQPNCIRAPCATAYTAVLLPDGTTVRVPRIGYARGTPPGLKLAFDRDHPFIRYEGKVWIRIGDGVAIIVPTSATRSRWR